MPLVLNLGLIFTASFVLVKAVKLFIKSSSKIAQHLGISKYTISFLLVAVATSLPEMVVGVTAAFEKNPILAYGNAIGSNIALLTLIIAIPIILGTPLSTRHVIHSKDAYYSTFFSFLPLILSADGTITRLDSILLLGAYSLYSGVVLRRSHGIKSIIERFDGVNVWKQGVLFAFSLALLLGSSAGVVKAATNISQEVGLTLGFVGLTITAIGTSLPEIAFVLGATQHDGQDEVLGDIIGSVVANSTLVLGSVALIHPIKINGGNGKFSVSTTFFLVIALLLFLKFTKSKEKIDKKESVALIMLYVLFISVEYYLQLH